MGISEKMNNFADGVKTGVTSGFSRTVLFALRGLTGFFLGLTLGLVGQEAAGYGTFSLLFVLVVVMAVFFRVSRAWSLAHVLIFDLVMVLVGQLLRMYILLAP